MYGAPECQGTSDESVTDDNWTETRLASLLGGDKAAWDQFVARFAPIIYAAIRRAFAAAAWRFDDSEDVFQDVFLRLSRDNFRLLRNYDPARAVLSTYLTIVSRSVALNAMRRKRLTLEPLEAAGDVAAEAPPPPEPLQFPPDLLTPRQRLIMAMTYEDDLDASEIAAKSHVNPQTVRSTRHKALQRLREYFGDQSEEEG